MFNHNPRWLKRIWWIYKLKYFLNYFNHIQSIWVEITKHDLPFLPLQFFGAFRNLEIKFVFRKKKWLKKHGDAYVQHSSTAVNNFVPTRKVRACQVVERRPKDHVNENCCFSVSLEKCIRTVYLSQNPAAGVPLVNSELKEETKLN